MKQFKVGKHKTAGGHEAIVIKLAMIAGEWRLKGAIRCPQTGTLHLTAWTLGGISVGLQDPEFNLAEYA